MKKLITSSRNLIQQKLSIPSSSHVHINVPSRTIQSNNAKQRWSLQSLASMKDPTILLDDNKTIVVDKEGKKLNVQFKNKSSYNADVLLQDLNCRLAQQYEKCSEMLHQIMTLDTSSNNSFVHTSSSSNNNNTSTSGERKVIKAVNQVVTNGNYLKQFMNINSREIIEMEKQKIIKVIKNLEILHKDTFKVCRL